MILMTVFALAAGITACPSHIIDRQAVVDVPAGWESRVVGSPRELGYPEVHWGPPERIPSRSLRGDDRTPGRIHWGLDAKQDTWVVCHYADSAAVLTRRIGRVRGCTFTRGSYAKAKSGRLDWRPASMVCRPA